ncbi:geranylgeranyl pyrophosphate synthase [Catellatospora sp. TT07R-123]|uniref:polyprenyl synthetase family protein n=1 Tax=Catellatospora sp. TT07R-123 TaxID=2733863 RepID=UPI001B27E0C2|nr:polyprenyl synthetase family protein [Catellatospora sp. TT07R-123]GHJ45083.1 geranylgeranyl pyrophosphate synthase [Catellatospora sp. TT07R-123]
MSTVRAVPTIAPRATGTTRTALTEPAPLRQRFDAALAHFLNHRADELGALEAQTPATRASGLAEAMSLIRRFVLADGKRLRPLFCYWGWRCAGPDHDPAAEDAVIAAAAALELFHSFALIHDDLMDASDLRRGEPTLHRAFTGLPPLRGAKAERERLAASLAILAGDLCAMWSDQMFEEAGADRDRVVAARHWLALMRSEVMVGQYLDLTVAGGSLSLAEQVIRYKTARYTVTRPLQIGAALAGAPAELLDGFERFGDPLGAAFQLRDDLLGVFGEPEQTGKSVVDDLREGKPTVLIGLALARADTAQTRTITSLYGRADLTERAARRLRAAIAATGAPEAVEMLIEQRWAQALAVLDELPVAADARAALCSLAAAAVTRRR